MFALQKQALIVASATVLFSSNILAEGASFRISDQSRIEFSEPLQGKEKNIFGAGWKRATLIRPSADRVELLPSERLTSKGGTIFSGADYSSISPSRKYVVLSIIRTGILDDGPAQRTKSISDREYCPVVSAESGCILNSDTGAICGGEWDPKDDTWRVGRNSDVGDDTAAMLRPIYSDAIGLWSAFSKAPTGRLKSQLKDRVADNLGVTNLLACDPPSARNREAYVSIARQLEAEGSAFDARYIRRKLPAKGDGSGAAPIVLLGDFEGNHMIGKIAYRDTHGHLSVEYYSPSLSRSLFYSVGKFDVCSSMAIYKIPNARQIAIDGSCSSHGGQIYRYIYEWKRDHSNWCLIREITGERADLTADRYFPSERVSRIKGCSTIGTMAAHDYESVAETTKEIEHSLEIFRSARKNGDSLAQYFNSTTAYDASELAQYVSATNVIDFNDIAYFLAENGRPDDAIPLLETILRKFPRRIVTKLNLADAYWNIGITDRASIFYSQYHHDMTSNNMKEKIPSRVIGRMK